MTVFRKLVLGAAIATAVTGISLPASAQGFSRWGGIYIGATAGWVGTELDTNWINRNPQSLEGNFKHEHDSAVFTGLVGIQAQLGQLVLGAEMNFGGRAFANDNFEGGHPNQGCPNTTFRCQGRADGLLFTVGPRLGWAFSDNWMAFVTGGYATWNAETRSINNVTDVTFDQTRRRHDGWFIGGGIEYAITRSWIVGVEYQHIELDTERHISSASGIVDVNTRDIDLTADIVRARLSFKFGRPEERYEPLK